MSPIDISIHNLRLVALPRELFVLAVTWKLSTVAMRRRSRDSHNACPEHGHQVAFLADQAARLPPTVWSEELIGEEARARGKKNSKAPIASLPLAGAGGASCGAGGLRQTLPSAMLGGSGGGGALSAAEQQLLQRLTVTIF